MQPSLMIFVPENKFSRVLWGKEPLFPCLLPLTATPRPTGLSAEAPLLLMRALVEDERDGRGGSIPSSLEYLILEPPLIGVMVPLSQV